MTIDGRCTFVLLLMDVVGALIQKYEDERVPELDV
jgi:hypothetical protein